MYEFMWAAEAVVAAQWNVNQPLYRRQYEGLHRGTELPPKHLAAWHEAGTTRLSLHVVTSEWDFPVFTKFLKII